MTREELLRKATAEVAEAYERAAPGKLPDHEDIAMDVIALAVEACADLVEKNSAEKLPCGSDECLAKRIRRLGLS